MKRKKITAGILLLLSIWILPYLTVQPVYALPKKGTITIQLTQLEGASYENVKFSLYKVGTWNSATQSWTLDDTFSDSGITLSSLNSNSAWDSAAKTLEGHSRLSSTSSTSVKTDSTGKAASELFQGMYLIVQTSGTDTYGTVSSFLVGIPVRQNDGITYAYEQEVSPKATKTISPPTGEEGGNGSGSEGGGGSNTNGSSSSGNTNSSGGSNTTDSSQLVPNTETILEKAEQGTTQEMLETKLSDVAAATTDAVAESDSVLPKTPDAESNPGTGQMQDNDSEKDEDLPTGENVAEGSTDGSTDGDTDGNTDADTNGESSDAGLGTMGTAAAVAGGIAAIGCGITVGVKAMSEGSMIGWKRRKK